MINAYQHSLHFTLLHFTDVLDRQMYLKAVIDEAIPVEGGEGLLHAEQRQGMA